MWHHMPQIQVAKAKDKSWGNQLATLNLKMTNGAQSGSNVGKNLGALMSTGACA